VHKCAEANKCVRYMFQSNGGSAKTWEAAGARKPRCCSGCGCLLGRSGERLGSCALRCKGWCSTAAERIALKAERGSQPVCTQPSLLLQAHTSGRKWCAVRWAMRDSSNRATLAWGCKEGHTLLAFYCCFKMVGAQAL